MDCTYTGMRAATGVARMVQLHKQEFVNVLRKGLSVQNLLFSQNYHLVQQKALPFPKDLVSVIDDI